MESILEEVNTQGKGKRTKIALNCRIPYQRFIKYLCIMIFLNLLNLEDTGEEIFISITSFGKKFLEMYSNS
jgi:predicted transcriptional regulator